MVINKKTKHGQRHFAQSLKIEENIEEPGCDETGFTKKCQTLTNYCQSQSYIVNLAYNVPVVFQQLTNEKIELKKTFLLLYLLDSLTTN